MGKSVKSIQSMLRSKKGYSMVTFIILAPLLTYLTVYMVSSFVYTVSISKFQRVANATFDRVLIDGQLTEATRTEMTEKLERMGVKSEHLKITANDEDVVDLDDSTFVERGENIKITMVYEKPHLFYRVNRLFLGASAAERTFYLTASTTGMSEKLVI